MRIPTNKDVQKHDRKEKAIRDFTKADNMTIYDWFKDIIIGKVKKDNRPEYQRMLTKIQPGDTIIVSDLDRLGRDASNTIIEIKELQCKGMKFIALDIPYIKLH